MKIAILGATSEIAKDVIRWLMASREHECVLFARCPQAVEEWQLAQGFSVRYPAHAFDVFMTIKNFDAVINFVGIGDPAIAARMGASILEVTTIYDELALAYIKERPQCRYLFMSSGAVYGGSFEQPAGEHSIAAFAINDSHLDNWYAIAKFCAEMRHRALPRHQIIDIRVFNYISRYQDMKSRFFIADMVRAMRAGEGFKTSSSNFFRDYISPIDFCQLVGIMLTTSTGSGVVDCYSKAPVDKHGLLKAMSLQFGLVYEFEGSSEAVNVTGLKPNYYSIYHVAEKWGYAPTQTAIDAVIGEVGALLGH